MTDITIDEIKKIIEIKESMKYGSSFSGFYSKIEQETNDLPLIQREQYRLFCLFCLYQIYKPKSKSHLPELILNFHSRLLSDRYQLTAKQIQQRWKDFGVNSPYFLNSLEIVANGNPDLNRIISFIKTPATGNDFMNFLNENSNNLKSVLEYNPEYLSFLPKTIPNDLHFKSLISEEEYEQVKLNP